MRRTLAFLFALCMVLTLCACNENIPDDGSTTLPTTGPFAPAGPLYDRSSYSASDADALAAHDTTVLHVGSAAINNGFLQFAYWSDYFTFLDLQGYYAAMLGLDHQKPLDAQLVNNTTYTWQHYFLRNTLDALHESMALMLEAESADLELPEEMITDLNSLEADLDKAAKENGFETGEEYLRDRHGAGVTVADFCQYMRMTYLSAYYYSLQVDAIAVTDEKIEAYYNQNQTVLNQSGIVKDGTMVRHLRHILLPVEDYSDKEGATRDDATEADWEKCRQAAEALLEEWLGGEKTEDSFAALAEKHSKDEGSRYDGGLYQGCTDRSSFDQPFRAWYMAAQRQTGDYGIIKSAYGYHLMYFVEAEETWHYQCGNAVYNVALDQIILDVKDKHPLTVEYSKITLGVAPLSVYKENSDE